MAFPSAVKHAHLHRGFTLVEILIVVTLFALMAAVLIPNVSMTEQGKADSFANKTRLLLAELAEYSVYSGELMALSITDDELVPMRFASYDDGFESFSQDHGVIQSLAIPPGFVAQWESAEDGDDNKNEEADSEALERWQRSDASRAEGKRFGDKGVTPDVFFYPSGETSSGTLEIYQQEFATGTPDYELKLSQLGSIEQEGDAE